MIKHVVTALAMLAAGTAPVAAQTQAERAPAMVQDAEGLGRFATPLLLFTAGAAMVLAIILLDSSDDAPVSP